MKNRKRKQRRSHRETDNRSEGDLPSHRSESNRDTRESTKDAENESVELRSESRDDSVEGTSLIYTGFIKQSHGF